jgi:programmed cell death protein 5
MRLANIAVVKPEKAEKLQQLLIQNAQRGKVQGKVTEAQMIDLLEQVSEAEVKPATTIKFSRKRFDDDDLEDLGF